MRVFDEDNNEVLNPDPEKGYGEPDRLFVAHHDAVEEVLPVTHYEVVAEYPNGGKDVISIIDVPGIPAADAWDEYEDIIRWHWYPDLVPDDTPTYMVRLEAQLTYTAMMTDTLLPEEI